MSAPHCRSARFGDLVQVELELALVLQNGKTLGVGLHQAVLDAVVDHLGVVAGADGPDRPSRDPAPVRGLEDRPANRSTTASSPPIIRL